MKAFGFDYDGVLTNIEPQKAVIFGETVSRFWGFDKYSATQYWIQASGLPRKSKFSRWNPWMNDQEYTRVNQVFSDRLKKDCYPNAQLLPYALETVQFVRNTFDDVFIASGMPPEDLISLVQQNGILQYFDKILGTDTQYPSKRKQLLMIVRQTQPDLAMYMTDSPNDIRLVQELGISPNFIPIAIPTNHSEAALRDAGAKYVTELRYSNQLIESLVQRGGVEIK